MSLEFTTGDLFAVGADAVVNTVNCVGVMGAGVALAFKRRYPELFTAYRARCRRGLIRPGDVWTWDSGHLVDRVLVFNMATKDHWRDPSRYEWVRAGLQSLRSEIVRNAPAVVALPPPGCGHGGLDWAVVRPLVEASVAGLDARVIAFEPR